MDLLTTQPTRTPDTLDIPTSLDATTEVSLRDEITNELAEEQQRALKLVSAIESSPERSPSGHGDYLGYYEARKFAVERINELPVQVIVQEYNDFVAELFQECVLTPGGYEFLQTVLK